jgi:1-acyl-sn-glycerol-3-phosphate acyltransferase
VLLESVGLVLVTVLLPALLVLAAIVDLALWMRRRKPWMAVRLAAFLWWFLFGEVRGMVGLLVVWLLAGGPWARDSPARRRRTFRLQVSWAAGHLAGIRVLFGLRFEVEGDELVGSGPVIVLIRHASIIDNTLPAALISRPHGLDLRYVLKKELEMLPTLDVGARWIPTCFVRRASGDVDREVARVRSLAVGLGEHDGVLIYPEGTRYTPSKLARAQQRIAETDPSVGVLAGRLHHLLPPRLGGPLALLDEGDNAGVVVCGHVGLDGFEYISDIWAGGLVGTTVRVRFWRHERDEIPGDRDGRVAWLYARWQALDDWIGEQRA